MFIRKLAGIGAVVFIVSVAAFAQTTRTASAQAATGDTTRQMTVVGCLVKEADYRKAHGLGKSFPANAGLGDEFVLVNTTELSGRAAADTTTAPRSGSSATCAETTGGGPAYRMTGQLEDKLKPYVGRRIEVTGHFDHPRDARTAAGLTNATLPPEIKIESYREAPLMSAGATAVTSSEAPAATTAPGRPAPSTTAGTTGQTRSTTAPARERRRMPRTASNEPLMALIGVFCLSASLGLRFLRRAV